MAGDWRLGGWEEGSLGTIQGYSFATTGLDMGFITRMTI